MARYKETSVFSFGKYKGMKVKDVTDKVYIKWLHNSQMNVFFTKEVLDRLNKIKDES